MATIRVVTHERRAGHRQRRAGRRPDSTDADLSSPRDAFLPVTDDPDELAPVMPPLFFALPIERDE
jgi:hypothetical protein